LGPPPGATPPGATLPGNELPAAHAPGLKTAPPRPTLNGAGLESRVRPLTASTNVVENGRVPESAQSTITRPQAGPPSALSPPPQQSRPAVDVQFWLAYHTEFGQSIRVVGSDATLGAPFFHLSHFPTMDFALSIAVYMAHAAGNSIKSSTEALDLEATYLHGLFGPEPWRELGGILCLVGGGTEESGTLRGLCLRRWWFPSLAPRRRVLHFPLFLW
jgi:hypothetical protein